MASRFKSRTTSLRHYLSGAMCCAHNSPERNVASQIAFPRYVPRGCCLYSSRFLPALGQIYPPWRVTFRFCSPFLGSGRGSTLLISACPSLHSKAIGLWVQITSWWLPASEPAQSSMWEWIPAIQKLAYFPSFWWCTLGTLLFFFFPLHALGEQNLPECGLVSVVY